MTDTITAGTPAYVGREAAQPAAITATNDDVAMRRLRWCLRIGAAGCFIGHGAFGIITKAAWLPYFAVVGIPPDVAYGIMPIVGAVDIMAGISILISPRPVVLLYMAVWALWTSLLRPLSGEPVFETIERAGNYGVPLALLLLLGRPRTLLGWLNPFATDAIRSTPLTVARVLHWSTGMLLFAHGALAAITGKAIFAKHYAAIGLPAGIVPIIGSVEMAVAILVMLQPSIGLLVGIAIWKMASEALYPIAGAPVWEFVERAGSYAAPLGLALMWNTIKGSRFTLLRSTK